MPLKRILRESRTGPKDPFSITALRRSLGLGTLFMAATRILARMEGPQWARIEDTAILCSPQKAKLDDNLAITVNFRLNGGIRRNFTRDLWEKAYDEHDAGLLMIFWVELLRNRPLLSKPIKTDKFKRRAIFFWTRNPELPYRVWMTVATEFETILYPKTEMEAQDILEIQEGDNELTIIIRDNRYLFVKVINGKLTTESVPE